MEPLHIFNRDQYWRAWPPWSTGAAGHPLWRSCTLIEAPENVVTGNRKCLLPWEEVSNRTASFFHFGEIFFYSEFYHWHSRQKGAFSRDLLGYTVFLQFPSSLWESQHCCCTLGAHFLSLFYQTCGGTRREWIRVWWKNFCQFPERSSKTKHKTDCSRCWEMNTQILIYCISSHSFPPSNCSFSRPYRFLPKREVDNLRMCLSKAFSSPRQCHT